MAAGTVLPTGDFPGRLAREVNPNPKCSGCMHWDGQGGRTGICTIGWPGPHHCGEGENQQIGYAPIGKGAGSYLPDLDNHSVQAENVGDWRGGPNTQFVSSLYGSGRTKPIAYQEVALGEEHVNFIKSRVEQHTQLQRSMCRLCVNRGTTGMAPANVGTQICTCEPISAREVAKSLSKTLGNVTLTRVTLNFLTDFVYDVAKSGFKMPIEKASFHHAGGRYDVSAAGGRHRVDFHPAGGGQTKRVGTFDSPRAARGAAASHARGSSDDVSKGERLKFRSEDDNPRLEHPRGWVSHAHASHGTYTLEEPGIRTGPRARVTYQAHDGSGHVTTHANEREARSFASQHHARATGQPEAGRQAGATYERHFGKSDSVSKAEPSSPAHLKQVHAFVKEHGFHSTIHDDHVKIHIPWTNVDTGEQGTDVMHARNMKQARDHLGY